MQKIKKKDFQMEKPYLRAKDGKNYLSCSLSHFWALVKTGEIPSYKISPRVTVFKRDDLDKYLNSKGC